MDLFPARPRLTITGWQLAWTCAGLFAVNLGLAVWMAFDAEARGRVVIVAPPPGAPRPIPHAAPRTPYLDVIRYATVVLAVNALVLGGLAFAVVARYLEALRRYNLGLPDGIDEHRFKRRHFGRGGLALEGRFSGLLDDDPPASRFEWPDE